MPEPRPSRLRQLLQRPDARPRLTKAVASLLGAGVVSIGVIGALIIWHLVRRGRLIRESLPPPRERGLSPNNSPVIDGDPTKP